MAPRAYWKGYLRLSLVSCPIELFPAASEREKISFHLINKKTGNRIKYLKVDAVTGEQVRDQGAKCLDGCVESGCERRVRFLWDKGLADDRRRHND